MSKPLLILFGTVTGNAEFCADKAAEWAQERGYDPTVENMAESAIEVLNDFKTVLIITSTYGEGDPPDGMEDFHGDAMNLPEGSKAGIRYSVLALGDTSYEHYCKTGHDFDQALLKAGAERIHPLVECDVDYDDPCETWLEGVFGALRMDYAA